MKLEQFFILGNPRSGTSLLRLMLNCHSAITVPPECGFLLWLYPNYKNWNITDLNETTINQFVNAVCTSRKFETWGVTHLDMKKLIIANAPENYEALVQCVYLSYAAKFLKEPSLLGDKNNYYINHLDDLKVLFKNKSILHLVRDGRDVAASYRDLKTIPTSHKYKPNLSSDVAEIAKEWHDNNLKIYNYYKDYKNYFYVKYEDLLTDAKSTLKSFLDNFNLNFEQEMMEFYKYNQQNKLEPSETLAWKLKTLEPLDTSNIGKYKIKLNASEINLFNEIAKDSLELFGYES